MEMPHFKHDCDTCNYLGGYVDRGQIMDLYFCDQGNHFPTVVLRYSDEPSENASGIRFSGPGFVEARRRAVDKGLITQEEVDRLVRL